MVVLQLASSTEVLRVDDYYIREIYSGYDELIFSISIWDEQYKMIEAESQLIDSESGLTYIVKAIDGGADTATIKAQINVDAWRSPMTIGYNSGSHTVADIVGAVKPTGWTVVDDSHYSAMRTIALDSATPLDVCEACRDTFGVTFRWDNSTNTITICKPEINNVSNGSYVSRQINLVENNYKGKSTGLYNRLYAYGKDNLSIAGVNPTGNAYVDAVASDSSATICAYWKDDRYTDAASLLADAQEMVNKAAVAERSYSCSVRDLAAANPQYSFLRFPLFATVTLIDETRNDSAVLHQVKERWHYPLHPESDKVILSTAPERVSAQVTRIQSDMTNRNSAFYQQFLAAVSGASDWITNTNGHVYFVKDGNNLPTAIMIVNDTDPNKVWMWSAGGLGYSENGVNGPFTTAITAGGEIVADFITTGELSADLIKAGVLTNVQGAEETFSINCETGEINASDLNVTGGNIDLVGLGGTGAVGKIRVDNTIDANNQTYSTVNDTFFYLAKKQNGNWNAYGKLYIDPAAGGNPAIRLGGINNPQVVLSKYNNDITTYDNVVNTAALSHASLTFTTTGESTTDVSLSKNGLFFSGVEKYVQKKRIGTFVYGKPAGDSTYACTYVPIGVSGTFQLGSGSTYIRFTITANGSVSGSGIYSQAAYNYVS